MRLSFVLTSLAAAALVAGGFTAAAAQEHRDSVPAKAEGGQPRTSDRLMRIVMNRRARLGIKINLQARDTDSLGAYVESVLPNGPAAKAGLRSGDIITRLGGQSVLAGGRAEAEADGRQSLPGLRLIELAARLEPNDTVAVDFLRGKDRRTVSVITEDEPDMFAQGPDGEPFAMRFFHRGEMPAAGMLDLGPDDHLALLAGPPLADLELAPLNPDLGQYFGTSEGVLVIRAPKEGSLGLKGGDVVQAVDGRKPSGPSHLLRILRSYDRGESFKLDIMRNRKRQTLTASLDSHDH